MERMTHPVHQVSDGFFTTFTGKQVSYYAPTVDMICIEDIAHALSNLCRFGGHSKHFYSVAQHSILVAFLVQPPDKNLFMAALLHDATEAYCGDVIKPLKLIIGNKYEKIESRFQALIAQKFGIDLLDFKEIKQYDREALEVEHEHLVMNSDDCRFTRIWHEYYDSCHSLCRHCMSPIQAYELFLKIFRNNQNPHV